MMLGTMLREAGTYKGFCEMDLWEAFYSDRPMPNSWLQTGFLASYTLLPHQKTKTMIDPHNLIPGPKKPPQPMTPQQQEAAMRAIVLTMQGRFPT